MIRIKICGLKDAITARAALAYGADYLGFVFAGGKRHVEAHQVKGILRELSSAVRTVGVFLNQSPTEVAEIARESGITHIQLHGDENPEDYRFIDLPIIKAVPVSPEGSISETNLTGCRYGLLDTRLPNHTGGTGMPFDWAGARTRMPAVPCFLAGGLNAGNVREAIGILSPYGVDVSSGVETAGIKNPELIRQFIETIRRTR